MTRLDAVEAPEARRTFVRTVAVDEARLVHEGLRTVLARSRRFVLVGTASTVDTGYQILKGCRPDLLVCDVEVAGESGLALCRAARTTGSAVAMLTDVDDPEMARACVRGGAAAYLLKTSAPEEILAALGRVMRGRVVVDPRLGHSRRATAAESGYGLSRRESEVLAEIVRGLDNRAIADRLYISIDTVKSHVKAILRKLGARDRAHVVALVLGARVCRGGCVTHHVTTHHSAP